jgi:hypothetical protein
MPPSDWTENTSTGSGNTFPETMTPGLSVEVFIVGDALSYGPARATADGGLLRQSAGVGSCRGRGVYIRIFSVNTRMI